MKEKLEIRNGGKLIDTRWIYNKAAESGDYVEFDVTDKAVNYLFNICYLKEGVTLKDLFLLINTDIDTFDSIFRNWLKSIVAQGLNEKPGDYGDYGPDNIEYLELCWFTSTDEDCFTGYHMPNFGGVGYKLKDDYDVGIIMKKGDRINFAIDFTLANKIINIPLKLGTVLKIHNEDSSQGKFMEELARYENPTFTLANIIYGVIWELSFHGGPEDMVAKSVEVSEAFKSAKNSDDLQLLK